MHTPTDRVTWLDRWEARIERRLQLAARPLTVQFRGAQAGTRFGLGRSVRLLFPGWLQVGNDVTIGSLALTCIVSQKKVLSSAIARAWDETHGFTMAARLDRICMATSISGMIRSSAAMQSSDLAEASALETMCKLARTF